MESEHPLAPRPGRREPVEYESPTPTVPLRAAPPIASLLAALWAQKWIVAGVTLLLGGGSVSLIFQTQKPEYRAVATVQISPIIPRLVFKTDDNGSIPLYASYVNTKTTILQSAAVLDRVLARPDVRATNWFAAQRKPRFEALQDLLTVIPKQKSELIDVAVTTRRAQDAAVLANAVVEEFLKYDSENVQREDAALFEKLTEELERRAARIRDMQAELAGPRREVGTGEPDMLLASRTEKLDALRSELLALRRQIAVIDWQRQRAAQNRSETGGAATATADAAYVADPVWQQLNRNLFDLRNRLAIDSERFGPKHAGMLELQKRVAFAEQSLREREAQLDLARGVATAGPTVEPNDAVLAPASLEERAALLQHRAQLLEADIAAQQQEFDRTLEAAEELKKRSAELRYEQDMYEAVRSRHAQKEVESHVLGAIKMLTPAHVPETPFRDRRNLFSALALCASLGAGVGLALVRARLAPQVRGVSEVSVDPAMPVLGELPIATGRLEPQAAPVLTEGIRIVRTALLDLIENEGAKVFQVASAGPGAGKTYVALLLAQSFARMGKRVLLVDADLRSRELSNRLGGGEGPGLVGALRGGRGEVRRDVTPNLSVLHAGTDEAGDEMLGELLANGAMSALLGQWREQFDLVLIDGPPVIPVADARILARRVDGSIFVVREGHCRRSDVFEALAALERAGGRIAGLVYFGNAWRQRYGYYGRYYAASREGDSTNREQR